MKVIAKIESKKYLCEVGHYELEKFFDQYFGKMKELKVGDTVDLGLGHDFLSETKDAMRKTSDFIESNQKVINTITRGILFLGEQTGEKNDD